MEPIQPYFDVAVWQCDFALVPASALTHARSDAPAGDLLAIDWWAESQPPADLESRVGAFLPERESWSPPDLRTWGIEDGTCIDVWREGNRVDSIRVRIDARQIDLQSLREIVGLARYCDAAFLRHDGLFVPATDETLTSAIDTSAAARFVDDPEAFIRRIALGDARDG